MLYLFVPVILWICVMTALNFFFFLWYLCRLSWHRSTVSHEQTDITESYRKNTSLQKNTDTTGGNFALRWHGSTVSHEQTDITENYSKKISLQKNTDITGGNFALIWHGSTVSQEETTGSVMFFDIKVRLCYVLWYQSCLFLWYSVIFFDIKESSLFLWCRNIIICRLFSLIY